MQIFILFFHRGRYRGVLKVKSARVKSLVLALMLVTGFCFGQDGGDSLYFGNVIRLDVGGKALGGLGLAFERNLTKKHPEKHERAFTSVEAGISYPAFYESSLFVGIGISRNWFLGHRNTWILNAGVYSGAWFAFHPTPKATRELYKETKFYGGNFVSPVESRTIGEIAIKYLPEQWLFLKISFTPFIYYYTLMNRIYGAPWAGASVGFRF